MPTIAEVSRDVTLLESEETYIRNFARSMLKGMLFVGSFQEKRYVECLDSYRDIVKISNEETQLIENLQAVKRRCRDFFLDRVWIGITEPQTIGAPTGHNLWVILDREVFGRYWYKIRSVVFKKSEICLKLEVVREYSRDRTQNVTASAIDTTSTSNPSYSDILYSNLDAFRSLSAAALKQFGLFLSTILTLSNFKEAAIFLFLFISAAATFAVHTVQYLMEYILKLLPELSNLIKVCSPTILAFIRMIMQVINNVFTLFAILWTGRSVNRPQDQQQYRQYQQQLQAQYQSSPYMAISYHENYTEGGYGKKSYSPRSSVRITPLN